MYSSSSVQHAVIETKGADVGGLYHQSADDNRGAISVPTHGDAVWARFTHTGGLLGEAVKRNTGELDLPILQVDKSKFGGGMNDRELNRTKTISWPIFPSGQTTPLVSFAAFCSSLQSPPASSDSSYNVR
jgi:hypothetical protein